MLFWLRPCRRGGPPRQVADSVVVTVGSGPSSAVRVGRLWPWEVAHPFQASVSPHL